MIWLDGIAGQNWDTDGGAFLGGPPKGVLHTTETKNWPGYGGGATAPHLTAFPDPDSRTLSWRQHISLDRAARALRNEGAGVQTNRDSAIQIELVGTCNPAWRDGGYFYWPGAESWALDALAAMMRRLEAACGISRTVCDPWVPYPASYGKTARQRMTLSQWDGWNGWCGHQHVPENTHGDPGDLAITSLVAVVAVPAIPPVRPVVLPAPAAPARVTAPVFPLPAGHYFGPRTGPAHSHSGYYSARDRGGLRLWQARLRQRGWTIDVDGLYGPSTAQVAKAFQTEKRLPADALIGARTWAAAWTAPVT
jgi:Putative peptidoglycan binding domain